MSPNQKIPAIAIHGVGTHRKGDIAAAIEGVLTKAQGFDLEVREFNWDQHVEHSTWGSPRGALWSLETTSFDIQAAGMIGISTASAGFDRGLSRLQVLLCNLLRFTVALLTAMPLALPALGIMVFLPTALAQIEWPLATGALSRTLAQVLPPALHATGAISGSILIVGLLRSLAQRSSVPLRASLTGTLLILLNPLLLLLSVVLALEWALVGLAVGFFTLFGLLAFLLNWLLPDAGPMFSMWDEYELVPYFAAVVAVLVALQVIHMLLGRRWLEGPIKVVLDILRYMAEPAYRRDILTRLGDEVARDSGKASSLVLVAHSLGSVIALDYLLNEAKGDSEQKVWVVTLGSPYRRFFLSFFPTLLFHRRTRTTAGAIARKFRSFRWLNVYRPWDPIGKSLRLSKASAGLDASTRQYAKINGHPNYWADPEVLETVERTLPSLSESKASAREAASPRIPPLMRLASPSEAWLRGAHFIFVAAGVAWMIFAIAHQKSEIREMQARARQQGLHAEDVIVTHQRIADVGGHQLYAHQFDLESPTLGQLPPIQLSPFLPASRTQQLFDHRRLVEHVRTNCELERPDTLLTAEEHIPCRSLEPIELYYLPGTKRPELYLPAFETRVYLRDADGWLLFPLALFVFISVPGLPFTLLAAGAFLVLLGRRVDEALGESADAFV